MHARTDSRHESTDGLRPPARPRLEVVPGGRKRAGSRHVFAVTLLSDDGSEWHAIGGGATVNEALAFAVATAPAGHIWQPIHWLELFGE